MSKFKEPDEKTKPMSSTIRALMQFDKLNALGLTLRQANLIAEWHEELTRKTDKELNLQPIDPNSEVDDAASSLVVDE